MRLSTWLVFGGIAVGTLTACGDSGSSGTGGGGGGTGGGGTGGQGTGASSQGGGGAGGGGAVCGGIAGLTCAADEFCDYPNDDCGADDGTGICTPRPEGCPDNYAPVCGCDATVHSNSCDGNAAGSDVNLSGGCEAPIGMFACGEKFCEEGAVCNESGNDVPGPAAFYGCAVAPAACTGLATTCACAGDLATSCGGTCTDVTGGVIITCPGG